MVVGNALLHQRTAWFLIRNQRAFIKIYTYLPFCAITFWEQQHDFLTPTHWYRLT